MPVKDVRWDDIVSSLRVAWRPGQHVIILGPTGSGKTVLVQELAALRSYCQLWAIKSRDPELVRMRQRGWSITVDKVPDPVPGRPARWIVWPAGSTMRAARAEQRRVFADRLDQAYVQGGWTIVLDELTYATDELGLLRDIRSALRTLRSDNVTVVACAQRPRRIPIEALTESTHVFLFRQPDSYDRDRLAELGGPLTPRELRAEIAGLPPHHFLWIDRARQTIARSTVRR